MAPIRPRPPTHDGIAPADRSRSSLPDVSCGSAGRATSCVNAGELPDSQRRTGPGDAHQGPSLLRRRHRCRDVRLESSPYLTTAIFRPKGPIERYMKCAPFLHMRRPSAAARMYSRGGMADHRDRPGAPTRLQPGARERSRYGHPDRGGTPARSEGSMMARRSPPVSVGSASRWGLPRRSRPRSSQASSGSRAGPGTERGAWSRRTADGYIGIIPRCNAKAQ